MARNLVLFALLTVCIAGCDGKTVATLSTPPGPTPEQLAKAKYEMDSKCAADTRAWYKANYPAEDYAEPIKVQGGGEIAKIQPTYENHYSHKFNGCFAVLDSFVSFPPPHAQVLRTHELYDVNENRKVGVLVQKDLAAITACNVEGTKCTTQEEFEAMVRGYLVE